jgi:hypothetical protein
MCFAVVQNAGSGQKRRRRERRASDISALFLGGGKSIIHGVLRVKYCPKNKT